MKDLVNTNLVSYNLEDVRKKKRNVSCEMNSNINYKVYTNTFNTAFNILITIRKKLFTHPLTDSSQNLS